MITARQSRALGLVSSGALDNLVTVGVGQWLVPSQDREGSFYVTGTNDCTCPDLKYARVGVCKHIVAIRLQRVLDGCSEASK